MRFDSIIGLAVATLCTLGLQDAAHAQAQAWPSKQIRLIIPSAAGGILDGVHRAIAQSMSETLGQPIVVDNRPGAGGIIGTAAVAKAEPDGYTIGVIATGHAIHPSIQAKLPYHPVNDFAFVSQTINLTAMLVAQPGFGPGNVRELIDFAKANPGLVTYGSAGLGQSNHFSGVMFGQYAAVDMRHVPYQGNAPALTGLLAGDVSMVFLDVMASRPLVAAGKLKVLGITGRKRSPAVPGVPLVREVLPNFDGNSWQGIVAPAGTPPAVVRKLSEAVATAVRSKAVRDRFEPNGVELVGSSPEQFTGFVREEIAHWKTIANAAGIKPE